MGYNIITFDLRSSGENTAKLTTFGALDKYDLMDYVEFMRKKIGSDNKKLHIFEDTAHVAAIDTEEKTYIKLIKDFLKSL